MSDLQLDPATDRRRSERRRDLLLTELTLPEFRRILITSTLFVIVLALFLWMVRTVIIAAFLGIVIAFYLRPVYRWVLGRVSNHPAAAVLTLAGFIIPIVGVLAYSYMEILDVAEYLSANERALVAEINGAVQRLPFLGSADVDGSIRRTVSVASNYGTRLPGLISGAIGDFTVAAAIFLFTAFYIFMDAGKILDYIRGMIAPRYYELVGALERNAEGVLYGAIYATLLTQTMKSSVILVLNLVFGVPLAVVLAVISFIIGFFPIIGSWSVYLPTAIWLLIFRGDLLGAVLMAGIGFFVNTIFFSMYLRPKIAAEKSRVLNFYWMFVGLVTGVYTFGIAGILLGPILIGVLKAVVDTVTSQNSWGFASEDDHTSALTEGSG